MGRKKNDLNYAYAVARVRANEKTLLTEKDIETLIEADTYEDALRKLSELGWGELDQSTDYAAYLEAYFAKTWDLLEEILEDDIHVLDMLLIPNDVQNLKAALKGKVSGNDSDDHYTHSTVYPEEDIRKAVAEKDFAALPEFMQKAAEDAYDVLTTTGNGQVADAIIDKAALTHMRKLGKESGSQVLADLAERKVAAADMKIALRCSHTGKSEEFLEQSIADCDGLKRKKLIAAAQEGEQAVLAYLEKTPNAMGALQYEESTSSFEKWCDDILLECVTSAKFTALGTDPIVAYYLARDAELKTVRIILSAKKNHLDGDLIRERVRTLYV